MRKNQKGFSLFEVILGITILVILILAGWHIFKQNSNNSDSNNSSTTKKTSENSTPIKTTQVPEGWIKYQNLTLGFTVYYPKNWTVDVNNKNSTTVRFNPKDTSDETLPSQLIFTFFNEGDVPEVINEKIEGSTTKIDTLTYNGSKKGALVENNNAPLPNDITFSACENTNCTFKIKGKIVSPSINVLGETIDSSTQHKVDKNGETYKTELKILETFSY